MNENGHDDGFIEAMINSGEYESEMERIQNLDPSFDLEEDFMEYKQAEIDDELGTITDEIVGNKKFLSGTHCSVCNEPQYVTPSGLVCKNGHGGVEPEESYYYCPGCEIPLSWEPDCDRPCPLCHYPD